ncbi:MAG: hypothetical protein V1779_15680 [bacterium]
MKRYLLTLIILPLLSACMDFPNDITIPRWDTEFNLPLMHRTYELSELIKTDKYISVDPDNGFIYVAHYEDMGGKEGTENFIEGRIDQEGTNIDIPVTNGQGTIGIPYKDGMVLDSAKFVRGTLTLSVKNNSSSEATVTMELPAFIGTGGNKLTLQKTIAGNATETVSEDLNGYFYDSRKQNVGPDSLQIDGTVMGGNFNGTLTINYGIENSMFSYFAGIVPPTLVDPIENSVGLPVTDDVSDFRDKMKLWDIQLKLIGRYYDKLVPSDPNKPFNVEIETLNITGVRNNKTQQFSLKLNGRNDNNLGPVMMTDSYLEEIYTAENSNLSDFLSFVPDSIIVKAIPKINPDMERGAATNRDTIQFGFDLTIKSVVTVKDMTAKDTVELEMDDDARDYLKDFKAATVYFKIDNKVAFGGKIVMHYTDSVYKPLFTLDTLTFEPADVNADGIPSVKHSEPTLELDSAQLQDFSNSYYIIVEVIINTTDSHLDQKAVFSSKDWLEIISFCKVKYHINLSEDE